MSFRAGPIAQTYLSKKNLGRHESDVSLTSSSFQPGYNVRPPPPGSASSLVGSDSDFYLSD